MARRRDTALEILPGLSLPPEELSFTAARSGGPGGQNVNKVASKVLLSFDVGASPSLSEAQRARILDRLAPRITRDGLLRVHASNHREQARNLEDARERLRALLAAALERPRSRRPTRPTRGSRERRLGAKRRRSEVKRQRGQQPGAGD